MRILILITVLVLSACSGAGDEPETTTPQTSPSVVVADWLEAVATLDIDKIDGLTEMTGLFVVASVENNLRSDELAQILVAGVTPERKADYWTGFRDDFSSMRGNSIADIEVGDEFTVAGHREYVAVEVSTEDTTGTVFVRLTEEGPKVDFAATVGPALVGPLGEYLESALAGEHAEVIGDAYRSSVVPALLAAASLDPENTVLAFEAEYIRQLVSQ